VDIYINELKLIDHVDKMLQLNSKLHYFPLPTVSSLAPAASRSPQRPPDTTPRVPQTSRLARRD
jgi:hypothetical protein